MSTPYSDTDHVIFVMGPTGAGKTTFINVASKSELRVGNTLLSCTDQIQFSRRFQVKGEDGEKERWVVLVDSPGFDDTDKSDSDILKILCQYLAAEYEQKRILQGVLYLHRITDNRVSGTSLRNLQTYQELCGKDALSNSAIATTMWSRIEPLQGERYERELSSKDKFFKTAIDSGAKFVRYVDTEESAHAIIRELLTKEPKVLRIQQELVDERKMVFETAAGEALMRELAKAEQKHQEEFKHLQAELAEAREQQDAQAQAELQEEYAQMEQTKKEIEEEKAKLRSLQLELAALRAPQGPTTPRPPTPIPMSTVNSDPGDEDHPLTPKKTELTFFGRLSRCLKSFWKRLLALLTCVGATS